MTDVIEGIFRDGHVELARTPASPEASRVLVTFLRDAGINAPVSDTERDQALKQLVEGMTRSKMTGGRGYSLREELYGQRISGGNR